MPTNSDEIGAMGRNALAYDDHGQNHEYTHESGVVVMPVASRTSAHRVVRLHGGYGLRRVKWRAARSGKPPIIPHAAAMGDTMLDTKVIVAQPPPQPQGGTFLFRAEAEYVFVQNTPRVVGTNSFPTAMYPFPVEPIDTTARDQLKTTLSQFAPPTTIAEFDTVIVAADNAIRSGRGAEFSWPLTVYPASFTAPLIMG